MERRQDVQLLLSTTRARAASVWSLATLVITD